MPTTSRTSSRVLRTAAALGAAALATGSLAACGSSSDGAAATGSSSGSATKASTASPAELLRAAPAATSAKGSSHLAVTATVQEGGRATTFHVEGDQASSPTQAQLELSAPGLGAGLGDVQLRYRDGVAYAKPATAPRWYAIDLAAFSKQLGPEASGLAKGSSPAQVVRALQRTGKLEDAGSSEIDGTSVRHIRGTVTTRGLVEATDGAQRSAYDRLGTLKSTDPEIKRTLDAPVAIDFFLLGDGAIRRMTVKATLPGEGPATAQVDLTDFGKDVDVQAPPAGQTQRLTPGSIGSLLTAG